MRPKHARPAPTESELEARRAALLAEEEARHARDLARVLDEAAGVVPGEPIDEKPFDLDAELGTDWKSKEFRGYKPPRTR